MVTKEEAIEIATKEVIRLGKDIESMELKKISKHSQPWNRYFPKESKSQGIIAKKNILKDREYWAVSYYKKRKPGQSIKGGGICVFIDSHTGEILTTYRIKQCPFLSIIKITDWNDDDTDICGNKDSQICGVLITPGGLVKEYDPETDEVYIIGETEARDPNAP